MSIKRKINLQDVFVVREEETKIYFIPEYKLTANELRFIGKAGTKVNKNQDLQDYLESVNYRNTDENAWDRFKYYVEFVVEPSNKAKQELIEKTAGMSIPGVLESAAEEEYNNKYRETSDAKGKGPLNTLKSLFSRGK